jgi:hypothetical protein
MARHTTPQEGLRAEKIQLRVVIVSGYLLAGILKQIKRLQLNGRADIEV